ncbi:MAG: TRAP transporter TatT component family protein, partial [Nitrospiraceae bacterium]
RPQPIPSVLLSGLLPIVLAGCAGMVTSATTRLANNLSSGILNQNDLKTVRDGAPAYMLLIDGLIRENSDNVELHIIGAKLYGAYAGAFVEGERARRLTTRARDYALHALCRQRTEMCGIATRPYGESVAMMELLERSDVPALYTLGTTWAGWIQTHSDDWNAIADLPKVKAIMQRVLELDEQFDRGGAHLYLGVLLTLQPPALGGKPAEAREHFERAIDLSDGRDLMTKVQFAKFYARLVFDRKLHDRLLQDVLSADSVEPDLTLRNTIAKEEARRLLATSEEYF